MAESKLTKAQEHWLRAAMLKSGLGAGSVTNRTASALEQLSLARWFSDGRGLGCWVITEAGRAALQLQGGSEHGDL